MTDAAGGELSALETVSVWYSPCRPGVRVGLLCRENNYGLRTMSIYIYGASALDIKVQSNALSTFLITNI